MTAYLDLTQCEDICLVSFLFYKLPRQEFRNLNHQCTFIAQVRVCNANWKYAFSTQTLDIVKNTPTCSQLTCLPNGGFLFQNNFHRAYLPIEMKLANNHQIRIRLPFHRMTWNEVFEKTKNLLLLHSWLFPTIVTDMYTQLLSMQRGDLPFFIEDKDGSRQTTFGYITTAWTSVYEKWTWLRQNPVFWQSPIEYLESHLQVEALAMLVWKFAFDTITHRELLVFGCVPRSFIKPPQGSGIPYNGPFRLTVKISSQS